MSVWRRLERVVSGLLYRWDSDTTLATELCLIVDVDVQVPVIAIFCELEAVANRLCSSGERVLFRRGVVKQSLLGVKVHELPLRQLCFLVAIKLLKELVIVVFVV